MPCSLDKIQGASHRIIVTSEGQEEPVTASVSLEAVAEAAEQGEGFDLES